VRDDRRVRASEWPADKINALRLGRRLVAEVPGAGPGRQAFVEIRPVVTAPDKAARREGWVRSDRDREFTLTHWDYDAAMIDGFDYDIGSVLVRSVTVAGEAELAAVLDAWGLRPDGFAYPGETGDPR
jgi:hypothetical protein